MRITTSGRKFLLLLVTLSMFVGMPIVLVLHHPQTALAGSSSILSKEGDPDSSYRGSGR